MGWSSNWLDCVVTFVPLNEASHHTFDLIDLLLKEMSYLISPLFSFYSSYLFCWVTLCDWIPLLKQCVIQSDIWRINTLLRNYLNTPIQLLSKLKNFKINEAMCFEKCKQWLEIQKYLSVRDICGTKLYSIINSFFKQHYL